MKLIWFWDWNKSLNSLSVITDVIYSIREYSTGVPIFKIFNNIYFDSSNSVTLTFNTVSSLIPVSLSCLSEELIV
jgi:hypothetical protein